MSAAGSRPTHALTINNLSSAVVDPADLPAILGRLDGQKAFALSLWRIPEGKDFDDLDMRDDPDEFYIQCAGDRDRLTVEVREPHGSSARQYVVGREAGAGEPTEPVRWRSNSTLVYPGEVFTAEEAAKLFQAYYDTGTVPPQYHRRVLD